MGGGMLVQPGFGGRRQGYRGDAAAKSSGAAASGRVGGSDVGESSTKSDPRDDGPDDRGNIQQDRNQRNIVNRSTEPKESILKKLYDTGQELSYFKNLATGNFPGLTKQLLFDLGKRRFLDPLGNTLFPEGDLQEIIKEAPDQRTYNIEATKDMVENLPGGLVKDIVAPAGALVMSPVYDTIQGITRGITNPNKGILQAIKDENILSSAAERFTGASAALAKRLGVADGGRIGFQEGTPKTTMVGNLKITVKPNESTEMAVLNALMNDIEGVVDDETKQDYYKILMPQLKNQMSKSRYEGLMGELFGRKDGGIGYLLGE